MKFAPVLGEALSVASMNGSTPAVDVSLHG
jgi:hypothetical protein